MAISQIFSTDTHPRTPSNIDKLDSLLNCEQNGQKRRCEKDDWYDFWSNQSRWFEPE
jgi:hypothetical protein